MVLVIWFIDLLLIISLVLLCCIVFGVLLELLVIIGMLVVEVLRNMMFKFLMFILVLWVWYGMVNMLVSVWWVGSLLVVMLLVNVMWLVIL